MIVDLTDQQFFDRINTIFINFHPVSNRVEFNLRRFFNEYIEYVQYVDIELLSVFEDENGFFKVIVMHQGVEKEMLFRDFPQLFPIGSIDTFNRWYTINNIINGDN